MLSGKDFSPPRVTPHCLAQHRGAVCLSPGSPLLELRVTTPRHLEFLFEVQMAVYIVKNINIRELKSRPIFSLFGNATQMLLKQSQVSFPFAPATCLTLNMTYRGHLCGNNLLYPLFPRRLELFAEIANKVTASVNCDCVYCKTEVAPND